MNRKRMMVAALAWASLAVAGAAAKKEIIIIPAQQAPPGGNQPFAVKAPVLVNDPAEPPLQVSVSYGNTGAVLGGGFGRAGGGRAIVRGGARQAVGAVAGQTVTVASSARGTVLTLNTPGGYSGTANLTFKAAPPMRFTMKLARLPAYNLQSLNVTSGAMTLTVGQVGTSTTTKYFDKKGQALETPTGAAYTVVAKREQNGEVEVQLRRGAGAALAKAVSLSWQSDLNQGGFGGMGGMGFPGGGVIIQD